MTKKKRRSGIKWWILIPVILIIMIGIVFYSILNSTKANGKPVYGRRCQAVETITDEQIAAAKNAISNIENLTATDVNINCLTVDITLTYAGFIGIEDAVNTSSVIAHIVDNAMGFPHYSEGSTWSKVFSDNGEDRMYDIHLTIFNADNNYTVFGFKHYQNNDIVYTTSNPKDQALVDELHAAQAAELQDVVPEGEVPVEGEAPIEETPAPEATA